MRYRVSRYPQSFRKLMVDQRTLGILGRHILFLLKICIYYIKEGFRFLERKYPLRVSPPFFLNYLGFVILFISSLDLEFILKI